MKALLFACSLLLLSTTTFAQSSGLYRLKRGENPIATNWRDSVFRFPEFKQGKVIFLSGKSAGFNLNYNLFEDAMEFIDEKSDTLIFKNMEEVKLVSIGGHMFYHDYRKGYFEILLQTNFALGSKKLFKPVRDEVVSNNGYGTTTRETGAVSAYRKFGSTAYNFDRIYKKDIAYFFITPKNRVYQAKKSSLLSLFAKDKEEIKKYLDDANIDFNNEEHLKQLVIFCNKFTLSE